MMIRLGMGARGTKRQATGQARRAARESARSRGRYLAAGLLLGASFTSAPCLANGRFPAADQLLVDPDDPAHLMLRATFGLLESRDGGGSWSWTCEAAVGYTGDPSVTLLRGGDALAGFFGHVSVSREGGCGWTTTPLQGRYRYAIDTTLDVADPSRAWLLAASADGALEVGLLLVDASGAIGEVVEVGSGFVPVTVEVAPSLPDRIYVSGLANDIEPVLLRSSDRGRSWQRFSVTGTPALPLFVSAVDPIDPDRLYARMQGAANARAASAEASDHLLVSDDGGEAWRTVFSLDADLLGFALSPDGQRLALGAPGRGIYTASTAALDLQLTGRVSVVRCLRWIGEGLYACGQEDLDGWTVARSSDEGKSFEPVWHQRDLRPLACLASGGAATCRRDWPAVARSIQADPTIDGMPAAAGGVGARSEIESSRFMGATDTPASADSGCAMAQPTQGRRHGPPGRRRPMWVSLVVALVWLARRRRSTGGLDGRPSERVAPGAITPNRRCAPR
jgi:photosystem II stability/assembly factor-like uncharacterized protein